MQSYGNEFKKNTFAVAWDLPEIKGTEVGFFKMVGFY